MAQIDSLLSHMRNTGASRAILRGDAPSEFQSPTNGISQGNVVPNSTLQSTLEEIAPLEARKSVSMAGTTDFQYNGFDFQVVNENSNLLFYVSPSAAAPFPVSPYGAPNAGVPNDSGQGVTSALPAEIKGFNWGAFLLPWFWPLAHSTWIGLLAFVPIVGFFMRFVLGFKGNEWAWSNRRFVSLDQFRQVQRTWSVVGLVTVLIGGSMLPIAAAILFPVFGRARENARRASCQSNLRQISLGVMQHMQDNGERFPNTLSDEQFKQVLQPLVPSTQIFECPSDATQGTNDYVYNKTLAGKSLGEVDNPATVPLMWDKDGISHLEGRSIAFADGHVKWYREMDAQALITPYKQ